MNLSSIILKAVDNKDVSAFLGSVGLSIFGSSVSGFLRDAAYAGSALVGLAGFAHICMKMWFMLKDRKGNKEEEE